MQRRYRYSRAIAKNSTVQLRAAINRTVPASPPSSITVI